MACTNNPARSWDHDVQVVGIAGNDCQLTTAVPITHGCLHPQKRITIQKPITDMFFSFARIHRTPGQVVRCLQLDDIAFSPGPPPHRRGLSRRPPSTRPSLYTGLAPMMPVHAASPLRSGGSGRGGRKTQTRTGLVSVTQDVLAVVYPRCDEPHPRTSRTSLYLFPRRGADAVLLQLPCLLFISWRHSRLRTIAAVRVSTGLEKGRSKRLTLGHGRMTDA